MCEFAPKRSRRRTRKAEYIYRKKNPPKAALDNIMATQPEVGVQDFVLLDKITPENFMHNLKTR